MNSIVSDDFDKFMKGKLEYTHKKLLKKVPKNITLWLTFLWNVRQMCYLSINRRFILFSLKKVEIHFLYKTIDNF